MNYTVKTPPHDRLVDGYSYTAVFRTIAFIGDSISQEKTDLKRIIF